MAETTDAPEQSDADAREAPADLTNIDAAQLAALATGATDEQLAEGMSDPAARQSILDEIFRRTLKDGEVNVSTEPTQDARVTFVVGPAAFLRLVSGAQPGPVLFMSGKLKIEGDLMFASQVATMFKIPQSAPGAGATPAA